MANKSENKKNKKAKPKTIKSKAKSNVKSDTRNRANIKSSNVSVPKVNVDNIDVDGKNKNEPLFIVKPAGKFGGLDYLHITLIVLIVVLIALILILSTFKVVKTEVQYKTCAYGAVNSTCVVPKYNSSDALGMAEKIIANYQYFNSSVSLLPYYIEPNKSTVSYLASTEGWLVVMPYKDPLVKNETLNITIMLSKNLSLVNVFNQFIKPKIKLNDTAVGDGAISMASMTECNTSLPIPVYYITDPYAYGGISGLQNVLNQSKNYNGKINLSTYFIFTGYSENLYSQYGVNRTQMLGRYLTCASSQPEFSKFVSNLNDVFNYTPLSNSTLNELAVDSGLNTTNLDSCMYNITSKMDYQAELASYYNVTTTPEVVVNCKYETIPDRFNSTVNYSISKIKGAN